MDARDEMRGQHAADDEAERNRRQRQQRQLAEQDLGDLASGETEHAQTGQFAVAFGERDTRAVVDHAEGDRAGQTGNKAHEGQQQFADARVIIADGEFIDLYAGHTRYLLEALIDVLALVCVNSEEPEIARSSRSRRLSAVISM